MCQMCQEMGDIGVQNRSFLTIPFLFAFSRAQLSIDQDVSCFVC